MRRVAGWALDAAAVVAGVLCLVVCVLWVRGYVRADSFDVTSYGRGPTGAIEMRVVGGASGRGRIGAWANRLATFDEGYAAVLGRPPAWTRTSAPADDVEWTRLKGMFGGQWGPVWWNADPVDGPTAPRGGFRGVAVPHGLVALVLAPLPVVRARAWRRRRRFRRERRVAANCCPACGYDCRATPGRCSECGWSGAGETPPAG